MIRIITTITTTVIMILATNAAWQHYHCGTPWSRCDPVQSVGCERIDDLMVEMEELKKMAKGYQDETKN